MPMIVFVSQAKYDMSLLERIIMENCNANSTPIEIALNLSTKIESKLANVSVYRQLSYTHRDKFEFFTQQYLQVYDNS
jgi:hypothetical protein